MKTMDRKALEAALLDYLYDELEEEERARFEASLDAHPEVAASVDAHRATRRSFGALPEVTPPAGLMATVLAEAREVAGAVTRSAEPRPGLVARLKRLLTQPAFATAMVAVLFAAIGVGVLQDGVEGPDQRQWLDASPSAPASVSAASERRHEAVAEGAAPAAVEEKAAAAREEAAPEEEPSAERLEVAPVLDEPGAISADEAPGVGGAERATADDVADALVVGEAKRPKAPSRATKKKGHRAAKRGVKAKADADLDKALGQGGAAHVDGEAASPTGAGDKAPSGLDVMRGGGGAGEATNRRAPKTTLRTVTREALVVPAVEETSDAAAAPSKAAEPRKLADDLKEKAERELGEAALWERYAELVEAGELDAAERVLARIEALEGGESDSTRRARATLAERRSARDEAAERPATTQPEQTLDSYQ